MRYSELLVQRVEQIASERALVARGARPPGFIPTGLRELDRRGGVKRGCLTIYGAATGEGKSIMKLHLATAAAVAGMSVLVIDMEDPPERTADRTLSTATAINNARLQAPDVTELEVEQLRAAVLEASWARNVEVHDGLLTADEALETVQKSRADLVLVDYLQGFPDGDGGLERTIAGFCWDLNKWSQGRHAGAVAFSQVRAEVEHRGLRMAEAAARRNPEAPPFVEGFRPFGPSDLAWCSAAGQRCKELGFLFRPGRYRRRLGDGAAVDDLIEVSFPKRNWGSEGTVQLGFDGRTARIYDKERT